MYVYSRILIVFIMANLFCTATSINSIKKSDECSKSFYSVYVVCKKSEEILEFEEKLCSNLCSYFRNAQIKAQYSINENIDYQSLKDTADLILLIENETIFTDNGAKMGALFKLSLINQKTNNICWVAKLKSLGDTFSGIGSVEDVGKTIVDKLKADGFLK